MEAEHKFYVFVGILGLVLHLWLWNNYESEGWKPCWTSDGYQMCKPD